jgi:hypothetical protein
MKNTNNMKTLQQIGFCNILERIITKEEVILTEYDLPLIKKFKEMKSYMKVLPSCESYSYEVHKQIIYDYKIGFTKMFKDFYKLFKSIKNDWYIKISLDIDNITFNDIPSIKELIEEYNKQYLFMSKLNIYNNNILIVNHEL